MKAQSLISRSFFLVVVFLLLGSVSSFAAVSDVYIGTSGTLTAPVTQNGTPIQISVVSTPGTIFGVVVDQNLNNVADQGDMMISGQTFTSANPTTTVPWAGGGVSAGIYKVFIVENPMTSPQVFGTYLTVTVNAQQQSPSGISNVKVLMGASEYTSFPVTLTPNNDGQNDFLQFSFTGAGGHDYLIAVDTNNNAAADPVTDWSQQGMSGKDWTFRTWVNQGQPPILMNWEGRDSQGRVLPNGTYQVWIIEDTLNNQFASGTLINSDIIVSVLTQTLSGVVTCNSTPVAGVRVNAGGPNAWGEATTNAQGQYTISGLKDGTYNVNAEKNGYFFNPGPNSNVTLANGESGTKNMEMQLAITVQVNVTLPSAFTPPAGTPSDMKLNVRAEAHNTQGPGWAQGNGQIASGEDQSSLTLNMQSFEANKIWSARVTAEFVTWDPLLQREIRMSYTGNTSFTLADVDANDDGTPDTAISVELTKALSLSGTVLLPSASAGYTNINVRLQETSNPTVEAWGWGNIQEGDSSGSFFVSAIAPGNYTSYINVDGYKQSVVNDILVSVLDIIMEPVTLNEGLSISGTINVAASDQIRYLNINANSPNDYAWHGQNVTIEAGATSAAFHLAGLDEKDYQLWSWLENTETTVNGGKPWDTWIAAGTQDVNITMAPYEGSIVGTVTWPVGVDYTKIKINATPMWGGVSSITAVSPNEDGSFSIENLSTGEYLIVADELYDPGIGMYFPTGAVAMFSRMVFVVNGQATIANINLETPYTVTGTIVDPEGLLAGSQTMAVAVPINFAMMGGKNGISGGSIKAMVNSDAFSLKLSSGTYVITLVSMDAEFACDRIIKVVDGDSSVNLSVESGYNATITVNFPAGVESNQCGGSPCAKFLGGLQLFKGENPMGEDYTYQFVCGDMGGGGMGGQNMLQLDEGATSATVTYEHLKSGNYTVRFFSPEYVMSAKSITIDNADAATSMTLAKGASISGKIVDAASGSPITSSVVVTCEAIPWVDGSYKSSEWDSSAFNNETKKFSLTNLPAGTYLLSVTYQSSTTSTVNYANISKYGIKITDDNVSAQDTIDIGTIKMKQGATIAGYLRDGLGNPLPNIPVSAEPMDSKFSRSAQEAKSGPDGYYSITSIDPDVDYYEVNAALRPESWDFMRQPCGYGEETLYNIAPGTADANFTLTATNASFNGTVTIPVGKSFQPPFKMGEMSMPSAFILLQKKGVPYNDPMGGIQAMSAPSAGITTTFHVGQIVPGKYRVMVLSQGCTTYVNNNLEIAAGGTSLDIVLENGATVSGTVTKPDGSFPTTNDLDIPVAMDPITQELVFGTFTTDPATNEISAYSIEGLKTGVEYRVALVTPGDKGPGQIYVQSPGVTPASSDEVIAFNAVMQEGTPTFMLTAGKSGETINIKIFSTNRLMDESASSIISTTGAGTISNAMLSNDKNMLSFDYIPAAGESLVSFTLAAHYGISSTLAEQTWSLDLNVISSNQGMVNSFTGGSVFMGGGDASSLYAEPGAIEDKNSDGQTVVDVNKSDAEATSNSEAAGMRMSAKGHLIAPEANAELPSWASSASKEYDFDLGADQVASGKTVTVTLQYNEGTSTSSLNILHYVGGVWRLEETNKTIDTVNRTISASVSSLSPFVAVTGTPSADTPGGGTTDTPTDSSSGGSGGGGGCFINSACSGNFFGLMLLALIMLIVVPVAVLRKK
jgi:hypothetical protein